MIKVNLSDAKANLSRLVDCAYHGERVIIQKNNIPLVELVPHIAGPRKLGALSGQFQVPDDFFTKEREDFVSDEGRGSIE